MAEYDHVKTIPAKGSERMAIMARIGRNDPWVQVEAILGDEEADKFARSLEYDNGQRKDIIKAMLDEEWGPDAPSNLP